MDKLEKVIQGLNICQQGGDFCYDKQCPYGENFPKCIQLLLSDTLELLKAQEPRAMTLEEVWEWATTPAEKRDPIFFEQKEGKGPSGWICNSLCPKDYYYCCLEKDARCWTSRPTDEQRKAVRWGV